MARDAGAKVQDQTTVVNAPSENNAQLLAALRLNLVAGVGPRTQQSLLARFGTPQAVFAASGDELLDVDGIGPKLAAAVQAAAHDRAAERELARCRELAIDLILRGDPRYPEPLEKICDPPGVLYCQGQLEPGDQLSIAIVGSRRCTIYGRQQAEKLAGALTRAGMTVVSGLARGIDAAAHEGALAAGGRTIAVLGTGLDRIYPPEHVDLARRVARQGALVAETSLDQAPLPGLFPQRNRIISGLSLGVIVIEATRNSGALHTVRHAVEQGREVFAVPGRIDSLASEGCHDIIRDGATLIRHADDVLQALGSLVAPVKSADGQTVRSARELSLDPQEREILQLVTTDPVHVDEILRGAAIETSRVLATLTVLEMRRLVRRLPGGQYCRLD
ncbi:MAG: DNA-protecting protein DprA [Planctomycetaceae bacterium]|nr:DNA-protecting protein DprA [Planctomycetaceae bacterium]